MVTYSDVTTPTGNTDVDVTLIDANTLDSRGVWGGPLPKSESTVTFPMTVENDEWRIEQGAERDDRLGQLVQLALPAGLALLLRPDRADPGAGAGRSCRRDDQFATSLMRGLLRGPGTRLSGVSRSFIPKGLTLDLSVPVSADGLAEVSAPGGHQRPRPRDHRADDGPDRVDPAPGPERRTGPGQRGGHPDHARRGGPRLRRRDRPGLRPQRRLLRAGPVRAAQPPAGDLGQRSRGAGRRPVRPERLHPPRLLREPPRHRGGRRDPRRQRPAAGARWTPPRAAASGRWSPARRTCCTRRGTTPTGCGCSTAPRPARRSPTSWATAGCRCGCPGSPANA